MAKPKDPSESSHVPVRRGRLEVLQAGRGIAALAVVLSHADQATVAFLNNGRPSAFSPVLSFGYLGVDFFFVLSGFIMAYSAEGTASERGARRRFVIGRVIRIYGPYLPIGVGLAILYTVFPAISASDRTWGWFTTITLLPSELRPALNVAWTLRHEVIFYLLFAAFYFSSYYLVAMGAWMAAILATSLLGLLNTYPILSPVLGQVNLEFGMGTLVALLYLQRRTVNTSILLLTATLALAVWIALGVHRDHSSLVGVALSALLLLAVQLEGDGNISTGAPLLLLGASSYALYLVHPAVISAVIRLYASLGVAQSVALGVSILIAASIAAAWFYYAIVERPLLGLGRRLTSGNTESAPVAGNKQF